MKKNLLLDHLAPMDNLIMVLYLVKIFLIFSSYKERKILKNVCMKCWFWSKIIGFDLILVKNLKF